MEEQLSAQDLPYTNREIREWRHDLSNDIQGILAQTIKTNGSVADINRWRERINGGAIVAGVFMSIIVVPILAWAVWVLVGLPTTIRDSVDKALSAYEVNK